MENRIKALLPVVAVTLLLSLLVVAPAHSHGGEGEGQPDPAGRWLVGLIYAQLVMAPVVGIWLAGETLTAWRSIAGGGSGEGG